MIVKKYKLTKEQSKSVKLAEKKKVEFQLVDFKDSLTCILRANNRKVGQFTFLLTKTDCTLTSKHIIEQDFYPYEMCLFHLIKYLKKIKVKNLEL